MTIVPDHARTPSGAVISEDGRYRYLLWRTAAQMWLNDRLMVFIMLNPSTADDSDDDPTVRRCRRFAAREGCDNLEVVNLYGYRATDPDELRSVADPVGPENVAYVAEAIGRADFVVCAWGGKWRKVLSGRRLDVEGIAYAAGKQLSCLKLTKLNDPGHPLYLRGDAPLLRFP